MIDDSPRSADAIALEDCKLAAIDTQRFEQLIQNTPKFALQVMCVMAERLRKATEISIQDKIKRVNPGILDSLFLDDD